MTAKILLAALVILVLAAIMSTPVLSQEERFPGGMDRLTGKVVNVDRSASIIRVAYNGVQREVVFNESTRFTLNNQRSSLDEVKEGRRVICRGRLDRKNRMVASLVVVRDDDD